ncbi:hypothetical protein R3I94_009182 [Phoxinus phoxinus]
MNLRVAEDSLIILEVSAQGLLVFVKMTMVSSTQIRAIETKTCSNLLDCAGCLGLYSCNVALGKCQLKGLSRKSGGFYQSLKDA